MHIYYNAYKLAKYATITTNKIYTGTVTDRAPPTIAKENGMVTSF